MSFSQSYRPSSPSRTLSYALDDLNISSNSWKNFSDPVLRFKSRYSPNLRAALGASDRIQQRVERVIDKKSPRTFVSVKINIVTYFCTENFEMIVSCSVLPEDILRIFCHCGKSMDISTHHVAFL